MLLKKNGAPVQTYVPSYAGKRIGVAIDSSKSNSAMVVGDVYGNILDDYELNGKQDTDVLRLCYEERKQLKLLFEGAHIEAVGIEDIITKKRDNNKTSGLDIHQSRFKITAVFMSFIMFFQDNFNVMPELINNWSWKADTLPEEYRTQQHHKGSLDFERAIGSAYGYRSDDVTDAVHIWMYMVKKHGWRACIPIETPRQTNVLYNTGIICPDLAMPDKSKEFVINESLLLKQNTDTMVSMLSSGDLYAYAKVPITYFSIDEIYKYAMGKRHTPYESVVQLVCKRRVAA